MIERWNLLCPVFGENLRRATFTISSTTGGGLLQPKGGVKTRPQKTRFRTVNLYKRFASKSKIEWMVTATTIELTTRIIERIPTMCEMTWNTWWTCERSWCQCMSLHALKILRFRCLSFLLSVSVVVLWLSSLFDARTLWLKFESSLIP